MARRHQLSSVSHDDVDVFVGSWGLVDDGLSDSGLDPLLSQLRSDLLDGELLPRGSP